MSIPLSHFLVALPCEAKPLIAHYRLKRRLSEEAFPVYEGSGVSLTVAGIGKTAMAAAVAYTHVAFGTHRHSIWLNVGVAGHQTYRLGDVFIADKITDADSARRWYPSIVYRSPCPSHHVCTVSRPNTGYPQPVLYDMEASAFYETATRFSSSELVQCIKVISDNALSPAAQIRPRQVTALINNQVGIIDEIWKQSLELAEPLQVREPVLFRFFIKRWHFTMQQQTQLRRLLQRWEILAPNAPPDVDELSSLKPAKEVLARLRRRLDKLPVSFS